MSDTETNPAPKTKEEKLAALSREELQTRRDEYQATIDTGKPNSETHRLLAICDKLLAG